MWPPRHDGAVLADIAPPEELTLTLAPSGSAHPEG